MLVLWPAANAHILAYSVKEAFCKWWRLDVLRTNSADAVIWCGLMWYDSLWIQLLSPWMLKTKKSPSPIVPTRASKSMKGPGNLPFLAGPHGSPSAGLARTCQAHWCWVCGNEIIGMEWAWRQERSGVVVEISIAMTMNSWKPSKGIHIISHSITLLDICGMVLQDLSKSPGPSTGNIWCWPSAATGLSPRRACFGWIAKTQRRRQWCLGALLHRRDTKTLLHWSWDGDSRRLYFPSYGPMVCSSVGNYVGGLVSTLLAGLSFQVKSCFGSQRMARNFRLLKGLLLPFSCFSHMTTCPEFCLGSLLSGQLLVLFFRFIGVHQLKGSAPLKLQACHRQLT